MAQSSTAADSVAFLELRDVLSALDDHAGGIAAENERPFDDKGTIACHVAIAAVW